MAEIHQITRTFSSAEILALFTTPQEVIPAQGAGALILVDYVTCKQGDSAYTTAGNVGLFYGSDASGDPADFFAASGENPIGYANRIGTATGSVGYNSGQGNAQFLQNDVGLGVVLAAASGNPTVGTTPVTVTVQYRVLTGL